MLSRRRVLMRIVAGTASSAATVLLMQGCGGQVQSSGRKAEQYNFVDENPSENAGFGSQGYYDALAKKKAGGKKR